MYFMIRLYHELDLLGNSILNLAVYFRFPEILNTFVFYAEIRRDLASVHSSAYLKKHVSPATV